MWVLGTWAVAAGEASTPELRVQLFPKEAQPGVAVGHRCDVCSLHL